MLYCKITHNVVNILFKRSTMLKFIYILFQTYIFPYLIDLCL